MSDVKVRAFRDDLMAAIAPIYGNEGPGNTSWESMSDKAQEAWRARYAAAREYFRQPAPDARVRAYIEAQEGCRLDPDYRVKDFDRAEYERVRALILQEEQ